LVVVVVVSCLDVSLHLGAEISPTTFVFVYVGCQRILLLVVFSLFLSLSLCFIVSLSLSVSLCPFVKRAVVGLGIIIWSDCSCPGRSECVGGFIGIRLFFTTFLDGGKVVEL
jgi:hypothetical protein